MPMSAERPPIGAAYELPWADAVSATKAAARRVLAKATEANWPIGKERGRR